MEASPADRPTAIALVPARAGSERVRGKNVRELAGHPLLAYSIAAARESGLFERIVVSTDSEEIREVAERCGGEAPFLRPPELASSTSPDIEWVRHAFEQLAPARFDVFAVLRPTSPFRGAATIRRAFDRFLALSQSHSIDSLRAVEPVKQHPGKMWVSDGELMRPLLDQSGLAVPWHSSQFASLPPVWIQNSSLEIAWSRVAVEDGLLAGSVVAPFETEAAEGFSIDYEDDWAKAERMIAEGQALPRPAPGRG
jgi:CMP-N,N'-diacetyllegionaminic acid synthase